MYQTDKAIAMYKYIIWNNNIIKEIEKAERKKALYENKGYTLVYSCYNQVTGFSTLKYLIK